MTKYFYFLAIALFVGSLNLSAQDKAAEKEWAKKMKDLKPLDYKNLIEERDALKKQTDNLSASTASYKSQIESKDAELEKLRTEHGNMKKMTGDNTDHHPAAANYKGPAEGIIYKVQIGNFKNKDLSKYFENNPNFSGEVDEDGTKKYTLGNFSDYWEADRFKKYMREMGVKDAWIVSYKDGKRVSIKDALEGSL